MQKIIVKMACRRWQTARSSGCFDPNLSSHKCQHCQPIQLVSYMYPFPLDCEVDDDVTSITVSIVLVETQHVTPLHQPGTSWTVYKYIISASVNDACNCKCVQDEVQFERIST